MTPKSTKFRGQSLIWVVMFLVVCEGAIRKWGFPAYQAQIYLVKDALLVVAYAAFLVSGLRSGVHLRVMGGLKVWLIFSLFYFGLQIFNLNSPSLLLSVVGFKNYLLYAPLAFVVPYMFSSSSDLERKLRMYALIMIPFAGLGLVQFAFGPDHWINGYLSHDSENLQEATRFGSEAQKARTTGTFSYPGGYGAFLTVMFYLGAGLAAARRWNFSESRWPLILLAITTAALFTTGSRGPIYVLIATTPLVLYIWAKSKLMSARSLVAMGLACVIVYLSVIFVAPDAIEAYAHRAAHGDDPIVRLLTPVSELYEAIRVSPLLGTGIGSSNSAAAAIMGTLDYWWLNYAWFELETARVAQETGVIGFILVYGARVWLLISAITLGVRFRTPLYAAISAVMAGLLAQDLIYFVINNATGGIYHWFAAGLLFAMYRLESEEQYGSAPARLESGVYGRRTLSHAQVNRSHL
jgi:hypothetical protein